MKNRLIAEITELLNTKNSVIIAIDGRCAAGKTTLASMLKKSLSCNVIPADDFFLRPEQRTAERLREPGGNIDYERLEQEVLISLRQGADFSYRPYSCKIQSLKEPVYIRKNKINIIEGSYSCHPKLKKYYDYQIFLTVDSVTQKERILRRNGTDGFSIFAEKWIPLEEKYFLECETEQNCNLVIDSLTLSDFMK